MYLRCTGIQQSGPTFTRASLGYSEPLVLFGRGKGTSTRSAKPPDQFSTRKRRLIVPYLNIQDTLRNFMYIHVNDDVPRQVKGKIFDHLFLLPSTGKIRMPNGNKADETACISGIVTLLSHTLVNDLYDGALMRGTV